LQAHGIGCKKKASVVEVHGGTTNTKGVTMSHGVGGGGSNTVRWENRKKKTWAGVKRGWV